MHELQVTESILNIALKHAEPADVTKIVKIHLDIGELSDLENEWIQHYFDYLSKDTLAEGAKLHFTMMPVEMTCQDCGRPAELDEWADEMPQVIMREAFSRGCECGSKQLRVTGGVKFGLLSIDVESDERQ